MFKNRLGTIRKRVLLGFVLIALLPVLSAAIGSVIIGIYNGRQQARERLESVAVSKEMATRDWLGSLQQRQVIVSSTDCSYERIWVVTSLAQDNKYLAFYNKAVAGWLNSNGAARDQHRLSVASSQRLHPEPGRCMAGFRHIK